MTRDLLQPGMTQTDISEQPSPHGTPFRNKTAAGLLASIFGWAGLHHWYLKRNYWWVPLIVSLLAIGSALRHDLWYFQPGFFVFMLVASAGFIEALVICLTPDERWDQKRNAHTHQKSDSGWAVVLIAIFTLMVGATGVMTALVLFFQGWFEGRL